MSGAKMLFGGIVACLVLLAAPMAWSQQDEDAPLMERIRAADLQFAAIGYRLATANAALCDRLEPGTGIVLHTIDQYADAQREVARHSFGFETLVAVEAVIAGSPAEAAGIQPNDGLKAVDGRSLAGEGAVGPTTTARLIAAHSQIATLSADQPLKIETMRGGTSVQRSIAVVPACRTRFELYIANDYTGKADGEMVQVSVKFLENYGEDGLTAVMAHELAHNILHHRDRLDAQGVDYGLLSGFGGNVKYFRQTELEADILSVSLLANAGYDPRIAAAFWRKFGPKQDSIFLDRSHPAWKNRVTTLERETAEVMQRSARPYYPPILSARDLPLDGDWQSLLVRGQP